MLKVIKEEKISIKNKNYETNTHMDQNQMQILLKSIINFGNENSNIKLWGAC